MDEILKNDGVTYRETLSNFTYNEAISYAKQEFEHWKQPQKGLLQQMFV